MFTKISEQITFYVIFFCSVHLGGGLTGVLLGPIFAINGLSPKIGGIIYGANPEAFRVRFMLLLASITVCFTLFNSP